MGQVKESSTYQTNAIELYCLWKEAQINAKQEKSIYSQIQFFTS